MQAPSTLEQLKSILALPFMAMVVIPIVLHFGLRKYVSPSLIHWPLGLNYCVGMVFLILGLTLFIQSLIVFIQIGQGTLAPWNPTKKLVVKGLYRYTRNPMILGVACLLLAEALLVPSPIILIWLACFMSINHIYFILKEEPDLIQRFGEEYTEYKAQVPRWVPRIKAWRPEEASSKGKSN